MHFTYLIKNKILPQLERAWSAKRFKCSAFIVFLQAVRIRHNLSPDGNCLLHLSHSFSPPSQNMAEEGWKNRNGFSMRDWANLILKYYTAFHKIVILCINSVSWLHNIWLENATLHEFKTASLNVKGGPELDAHLIFY